MRTILDTRNPSPTALFLLGNWPVRSRTGPCTGPADRWGTGIVRGPFLAGKWGPVSGTLWCGKPGASIYLSVTRPLPPGCLRPPARPPEPGRCPAQPEPAPVRSRPADRPAPAQPVPSRLPAPRLHAQGGRLYRAGYRLRSPGPGPVQPRQATGPPVPQVPGPGCPVPAPGPDRHHNGNSRETEHQSQHQHGPPVARAHDTTSTRTGSLVT